MPDAKPLRQPHAPAARLPVEDVPAREQHARRDARVRAAVRGGVGRVTRALRDAVAEAVRAVEEARTGKPLHLGMDSTYWWYVGAEEGR